MDMAGSNDARLDATVAPWLLGCFGKGLLRTEPSAFPTLAPRDPELASRHALAPPPYIFAVPQIHANSPGHARGKYELPSWFKRTLQHTRLVQSKDPNGAVGDVVLVEGPLPAGKAFCASSGIVHYAVPHGRHAKYRSVLEQISDATMWSTGEGKHEGRGVDVQSSNDLWLLSIIRYFYLQDFVRAAGVERLIYLDWDTVVYISAPTAWRVLSAASPPIQMAAGSAYPPYGTANNIYTAWTNESLADYVGYIATHVLLQIPAECARNATNGSALGLINSYSDCLQLFWCKHELFKSCLRVLAKRPDDERVAAVLSRRSRHFHRASMCSSGLPRSRSLALSLLTPDRLCALGRWNVPAPPHDARAIRRAPPGRFGLAQGDAHAAHVALARGCAALPSSCGQRPRAGRPAARGVHRRQRCVRRAVTMAHPTRLVALWRAIPRLGLLAAKVSHLRATTQRPHSPSFNECTHLAHSTRCMHCACGRYRVFNLYEPFGNGNVLSDSPVEGMRSHGTLHTGFRGELIGVSSALPGDLWETIYTASPRRSFYLHSKSKLFTWGASPGLMPCAPYASQRKPRSTNALMWGWEASAPSAEVFNISAHNDTERRFFRSWAITFSTPPLKEKLLPNFLLTDDKGHEVPCRSMRGGLQLYDRSAAPT